MEYEIILIMMYILKYNIEYWLIGDVAQKGWRSLDCTSRFKP